MTIGGTAAMLLAATLFPYAKKKERAISETLDSRNHGFFG